MFSEDYCEVLDLVDFNNNFFDLTRGQFRSQRLQKLLIKKKQKAFSKNASWFQVSKQERRMDIRDAAA
jgi:hypothetical protein